MQSHTKAGPSPVKAQDGARERCFRIVVVFGPSHFPSDTCRAQPLHTGRLTRVWEATVTVEKTGKAIAHFCCTQMMLSL
jgi:hypothetical protein